MKLNSFERAMMNNPIRAWLHKHCEAKKLLSLGGPMRGGTALEVGCGRGVGSELILNLFNADRVEAFDLDPEMVMIARKRLKAYDNQIKIDIGDATNIQKEDHYYDAVFDFGIIHHVPNWRDALREIHRVLKPGGRFYVDEILEKFITNPIVKLLFDHPQEDRFNFQQFTKGLEDNGFSVVSSDSFFQTYGFYIADKPKMTH
jgi:ubiquinone/menaquinone biosynthesis C-methylase UbiE